MATAPSRAIVVCPSSQKSTSSCDASRTSFQCGQSIPGCIQTSEPGAGVGASASESVKYLPKTAIGAPSAPLFTQCSDHLVGGHAAFKICRVSAIRSIFNCLSEVHITCHSQHDCHYHLPMSSSSADSRFVWDAFSKVLAKNVPVTR